MTAVNDHYTWLEKESVQLSGIFQIEGINCMSCWWAPEMTHFCFGSKQTSQPVLRLQKTHYSISQRIVRISWLSSQTSLRFCLLLRLLEKIKRPPPLSFGHNTNLFRVEVKSFLLVFSLKNSTGNSRGHRKTICLCIRVCPQATMTERSSQISERLLLFIAVYIAWQLKLQPSVGFNR